MMLRMIGIYFSHQGASIWHYNRPDGAHLSQLQRAQQSVHISIFTTSRCNFQVYIIERHSNVDTEGVEPKHRKSENLNSDYEVQSNFVTGVKAKYVLSPPFDMPIKHKHTSGP